MAKKIVKPEDAHTPQQRFIAKLRESMPPGVGLAEEIADILGISTDSAYRRIRGETGLTIDEIFSISRKYAISIDDVFSNRSDTVTFAYTKLTDSAGNFEDYMLSLEKHLKLLNRFEDRKLYYVAEEMPLFYSFFSPSFTDFKLFYWQRSVLNIAELQKVRYEPGIVSPRLVEIARSCYKEYMNLPSVEVWTDLTILTGIRQVRFYYDSGIITREQALMLMQEYRHTVEMISRNAESARKNPGDRYETFMMYSSEVVLGTNCIYTKYGNSANSYISFNTLNSLGTSNPEFCSETEHWVRNLERKSTLISGVAEKQRYQFFSSMYRKLDEAIAIISGS